MIEMFMLYNVQRTTILHYCLLKLFKFRIMLFMHNVLTHIAAAFDENLKDF